MSSGPTPEQIAVILERPARPPPNGVSNFENPSNQNRMTIVVTSICLAIATIFVATRIFTKVFRARAVKIEDGVGFAAYVFYVAHAWSVLYLTDAVGSFVHMWDIQVKTLETWQITINLLRTFYFLTIACSKNAILLEWKSIFVPHPTRNTFFWLCYALIGINTAFYVAVITATWLFCIPLERSYRPWVEGYCIDRKTADIAIMAFHLFTDVLILLLPQKVIWGLHMPTKRRIGISLLFSLGIVSLVCAVFRVYHTIVVDYEGDVSYTVSILIMWGVGELTCLLLVFCIPTVPKAIDGSAAKFDSLKKSLLSWSSPGSKLSTKGSSAYDTETAPSQLASSSTRVYKRMDESSQVELTSIQSRNMYP